MKRTLLIVIAMFATCGLAAGARVELAPKAEVSTAQVHLGDVARVSDCPDAAAKTLADVVLADAPLVGETKRIDLREVRRRLFAEGVNMAEVTLAGASEIEIARKNVAKPTGRSGQLAERVRRAVAKSASADLGRPASRLIVSNPEFEAFGIAEDAEIALTRRGELSFPGTVTYDAAATVGTEEVGRFEVRASLGGARRVVVAKHALSAGHVVSQSDVEARTVDAREAGADVFEDASLVIGERLARRVGEGRAMTRDDIVRPALVSRGDVCRLVVRGAGFHITGEARAREKGALGEQIGMESLNTRERFTAVVVAGREVEVRLHTEEKR